MSIWFYILIIVTICFFIKIRTMKIEIKNIEKSLQNIIKTDTNQLIYTKTNDKELKSLTKNLNQNLQKLRKLELDYKQGNRELKTSITNISHDLRTPLTAIRGYLDLLDKNNLSEKQLEYLNIIDKKTEDLTMLMDQLFYFSKSLETINPKEVCINAVLEETIGSFYALFKKHKIEPHIVICEKQIIKEIDENMLKRIFENILSNAVKYSENDISILLKENGEIEFTNKTNAIDATSLEKLFDRYYTVQNARKANGIGLSIAKQLVELNNGIIQATYQNKILKIKISWK